MKRNTHGIWSRPGALAAAAVAVFAVGVFLALSDLASSNRVHELDSSPWVTLLFAASAVLTIRALVALRRASRSAGAAAPKAVGWLAAGMLAFLSLALLGLLVAAGTAVQYLRA